jgi:hypothetical protein
MKIKVFNNVEVCQIPDFPDYYISKTGESLNANGQTVVSYRRKPEGETVGFKVNNIPRVNLINKISDLDRNIKTIRTLTFNEPNTRTITRRNVDRFIKPSNDQNTVLDSIKRILPKFSDDHETFYTIVESLLRG